MMRRVALWSALVGACGSSPASPRVIAEPDSVETAPCDTSRRLDPVQRRNGYRLFLFSDARRVLELEPERVGVFDSAAGTFTEVPA